MLAIFAIRHLFSAEIRIGLSRSTLGVVYFRPPRTIEIRVLLSMTGYGDATHESDQLKLSLELRAVNNRYLKVTLRATEPYHLLESEFERVVRKTVKRGTIQIHLRCIRQHANDEFAINAVALHSYTRQIIAALEPLGNPSATAAVLSQAITLPGVVPESAGGSQRLQDDWPLIEKTLERAVERLQKMRRDEGAAMATELLGFRDHIAKHLEIIRGRTSQVTTLFRDRLYERVKNLLAELNVQIDKNDLIRETAIYAERGDIAEEIVRLGAHLDHFQEIMKEPESTGKKLDFLIQEMFRETNTIGSKASDVEISRQVVEIKGTLEKMRELVQNVE